MIKAWWVGISTHHTQRKSTVNVWFGLTSSKVLTDVWRVEKTTRHTISNTFTALYIEMWRVTSFLQKLFYTTFSQNKSGQGPGGNKQWHASQLIFWLDDGKIINKTVYLCVGLKQNGLKEVLGIWVGKSESSSFRMSVQTDLKAREVQDILINNTDNLNGFTDTICTLFPLSSTQICVVHQIRNLL